MTAQTFDHVVIGAGCASDAALLDDERTVVDAELRVRGAERLRVADASVMPSIVSGNTNAVCVASGEKCADFVRGRRAPPSPHPLERSP